MLDVQPGNRMLFTRAEMDQTWTFCAMYKFNEPLSFRWGIINGLNQGLHMHDIAKDALEKGKQLGAVDEWEFYNKYAPQISPETATDAFIALHQGLNWNDKDKFPVAMYGSLDDPVSRAKAICKAHAKYGCELGDPSENALTKGQVWQRHNQKAWNDVGKDIWDTNYMRWLEQIDADTTSAGLFRIGGKLTKSSSKYARFARGLRHGENKTGMYFRLHQNFFKVTPAKTLAFSIIWYDIHAESWQVNIPLVKANQPLLMTKKWRETATGKEHLSTSPMQKWTRPMHEVQILQSLARIRPMPCSI